MNAAVIAIVTAPPDLPPWVVLATEDGDVLVTEDGALLITALAPE